MGDETPRVKKISSKKHRLRLISCPKARPPFQPGAGCENQRGKRVFDLNLLNSGGLGPETPRVKKISSKKYRPRLISCPSSACPPARLSNLGPDVKTNAGRRFLTQIFLTRRVWSPKPSELRRFPPKNIAQGSFPVLGPARPPVRPPRR